MFITNKQRSIEGVAGTHERKGRPTRQQSDHDYGPVQDRPVLGHTSQTINFTK